MNFNTLFSFLLVCAICPFMFAYLLVMRFIRDIFAVVLFGFAVQIIFSTNFFSGISVALLVFSILYVVVDHKLFYESFITLFDSTYTGFNFIQIIEKYKKPKEGSRVSPKISIGANNYRVIEYRTSYDPRNINSISGFVVISEDGKLIENKVIANEVVNLYLFWRKLYIDPILSKYVKISHKPALKFYLKIECNIKNDVEKRRKRRNRVLKIEDKEVADILDGLDQEVLEQHPFITTRIQTCLELSDQLHDIFLYPSRDFYHKIFDKIETIDRMSEEENKIWLKRQNTWKKLYKSNEIKINEISEPTFKWVPKALAADLLDFLLKQQIYPLGGMTIVSLAVEGGKKIKKATLKYLNSTLVYHKLGMEYIEKTMKYNGDLKKIRDEYKQILTSNNVPRIRNFADAL